MTTTINRDALLKSIADTISDYRADEFPTPTPQHVERWIKQFDDDVQLPMLAELAHVFKQTYIPRKSFNKFLSSVAKHGKLTGEDPHAFWKSTNFLDIQQGGNSQHEMLVAFNEILQNELGLTIQDCGSDSGAYLYLDDGIFTGMRIINDLKEWIESEAPLQAIVHIVVLCEYTYGKYYANRQLVKTANDFGKRIKFKFWAAKRYENRKAYSNFSDVLRPIEIPDDADTRLYADSLNNPYSLTLRTSTKMGDNTIFSSIEGRHFLEQELLKKGVQIRKVCLNLNEYQRPLGNMVLKELGFGSLVVTYRNCPNNAPLAFWIDEPDVWYPLFPRKSN